MDTKSKKSSKVAKFLIFLTVLIPTLILVGLYPRMERLMLEKQQEYREKLSEKGQEQVHQEGAQTDYESSLFVADTYLGVRADLVNYAVESAYYLYGRLLQEAKQEEVSFEILDRHGWINDFYTIDEESYYYVSYIHEGVTYEYESVHSEELSDWMRNVQEKNPTQQDLEELEWEYDIVAALILDFDEYGMISNIDFIGTTGIDYNENLYAKARDSVKQYRTNADYYLYENGGTHVDVEEVIPKNFHMVVLIPSSSMFVNSINMNLDQYLHVFNDPVLMYLEIGVPIVILTAMVFVALVALILPFIKKLNTGWEKLFCLPTEIVGLIGVLWISCAYLMFELMCYSTKTEISQAIGQLEVLGYTLTSDTLYACALVLNALGWILFFFVEYIIVAHVRQFFCGPIYYITHRVLVIRILKWAGRKIRNLYHFIVDVDITKGLHRSIIEIILINLLFMGGFCCFWYVGAIGAILYSLILYLILRNQGKKLQEQYGSIVLAAKQMAEGELKITLKEDLGMFAPLGKELERVQEGFSKAVAEEAKSQHMKTELISNVSHDLKTPLTAIITYVNLLKQENLSEEDRKNFIKTLDMKSQRLKVLIEDLFEVSKAQSGNITLNIMDVDVVNLMKQLRLEMEDKLADSDLTFRWNLPQEKVILPLDGQKTYRVFENLLSNALKYALPNSRVYVDVADTDTQVEIIFKNISAMELYPEPERLTERFVRGDASRTTQGSGLGLAIVKSFVEVQGGSFHIEVDADLFKAIICWKK